MNGMQGGVAVASVSRYCEKFFAVEINCLIDSSIACVFGLTPCHVRPRRRIGAVPNAEMIAVTAEKLFSARHFYAEISTSLYTSMLSLTSAIATKCFTTTTLFFTSECARIISAVQLVNWLECKMAACTFR